MDMIQYSNTGEYRQTPDARLKVELSEVEQILFEVELTDHLQKELDRCNLYFRNFKLRLTIEE